MKVVMFFQLWAMSTVIDCRRFVGVLFTHIGNMEVNEGQIKSNYQSRTLLSFFATWVLEPNTSSSFIVSRARELLFFDYARRPSECHLTIELQRSRAANRWIAKWDLNWICWRRHRKSIFAWLCFCWQLIESEATHGSLRVQGFFKAESHLRLASMRWRGPGYSLGLLSLYDFSACQTFCLIRGLARHHLDIHVSFVHASEAESYREWRNN